jgi:hypothetical protein
MTKIKNLTIPKLMSPDTLNSNDNIYNQGGSQLVLAVVKSGSVYTATFAVGFVL